MRLLAENSEAVRYMAAASVVRLSIEKAPAKPAKAAPQAVSPLR